MWKVTAGKGNVQVRQFLERGVVAIGYSRAGDYSRAASRDELIAAFTIATPEDGRQSILVRASQAWRFLDEVRQDDPILTYDPNDRVYHLGRIAGPPEYQPDWIDACKSSGRWPGPNGCCGTR